jgi:hydroxymethylbilane synthase
LKPVRIGTRSSPLALWQARAVAAAIERSNELSCELVAIKTTGDRLSETMLSEVGGKVTFVKEIEQALLDERIDLAVHSAKDLPSELPEGLCITAVLPREDPRDILALPAHQSEFIPDEAEDIFASLGDNLRIGTGSVRRVAQLTTLFPAARFNEIRGNIDTRLRKLDAGNYDLIVLAAAGLRRLGLAHRISAHLSTEKCVPAPGQGIVAIETRTSDEQIATVLSPINDQATMAALKAERSLLNILGGDCHVPIGGIATQEGGDLTLRAIVASTDGAHVLRERQRAPVNDAVKLGCDVGNVLITAGADKIISDHSS